MVVDTCIFFNELDLLEIRWSHLDPYVDRFVIVESTQTFQGHPKPAYFQENKERFSRFLHKVIHVLIPAYPVIRTAAGDHYGDTWMAEHLSRDILREVIRYQAPEDFIIIADADEIPDLRQWDRKSEGLFECYQHYYYLDYRDVDYVMAAPCIVRKETIDRFGSVQTLRRERNVLPRIPRAGWHYSCMGGADAISLKLRSFSHQEYNRPQFTDVEKIKERMLIGRDVLDRDSLHHYERVPIDSTFPPYVIENLTKFSHLISPGSVDRVLAIRALRDIKTVLDQNGVRFALDGGTLLGAYRDKDFCNDDCKDIDLTTIGEAAQTLIEQSAVSKGFDLVHSFKATETTTAQSILERDGIKIDIMYKKQKECRTWWTIYYACGDGYKSVWKSVPYFDFQGRVQLHGMIFRAPRQIEEYLTARYGDWKIPVSKDEFSCFSSDLSIVESYEHV